MGGVMAGVARTNWGLVLLLYVAGLGAAGQYGKVAIVFDRLAEVWPGEGATLGFAVSLVGFTGMLLGLAAGVLVARIGYRRALIWALALGGGLSLFQASLPALPVFLASRVVEGLTHLAIVVAAPTLIARLATAKDTGLALTLWSSFFAVAFALLAALGLPLARGAGIGALFLAHGVWMLAAALLLWRLLPAGAAETVDTPLTIRGLLRRHGEVYSSPRIAAPAVGWLFYTLSFLSLLTLLPPELDPAVRAPVAGAMPLLSIAVSMVLGVPLMRRTGSVPVIVLGFALCAVFAGLLAVLPANAWLCLLLAAAFGLVQGPSFAAVAELNPRDADRAAANGGLAQTGNIGNTLGTPLFAAALIGGGWVALGLTAGAVLALGALGHLWLAALRRRG